MTLLVLADLKIVDKWLPFFAKIIYFHLLQFDPIDDNGPFMPVIVQFVHGLLTRLNSDTD